MYKGNELSIVSEEIYKEKLWLWSMHVNMRKKIWRRIKHMVGKKATYVCHLEAGNISIVFYFFIFYVGHFEAFFIFIYLIMISPIKIIIFFTLIV